MRVDGWGSARSFLGSLDACTERVRRQPMLYPVVYETYRRALIRRFPYAIFFEYLEETVTIYAVFHTARDPGKWRQRLS
jgi:plasmid stabilization system protein ParE